MKGYLLCLLLTFFFSCSSRERATFNSKSILIVIPKEFPIHFNDLSKVLMGLDQKGHSYDLVQLEGRKKLEFSSIGHSQNYFKSGASYKKAKETVEQAYRKSRKQIQSLSKYSGIIVPGVEAIDKNYCQDLALRRMIKAMVKEGKLVGLMGFSSCLLNNSEIAKLLKGLKVTSFSKKELKEIEKRVLKRKLSYPLHSMFKKYGYQYFRGKEWYSYVVVDRNVITAQNYDSDEVFVKKYLLELKRE